MEHGIVADSSARLSTVNGEYCILGIPVGAYDFKSVADDMKSVRDAVVGHFPYGRVVGVIGPVVPRPYCWRDRRSWPLLQPRYSMR